MTLFLNFNRYWYSKNNIECLEWFKHFGEVISSCGNIFHSDSTTMIVKRSLAKQIGVNRRTSSSNSSKSISQSQAIVVEPHGKWRKLQLRQQQKKQSISACHLQQAVCFQPANAWSWRRTSACWWFCSCWCLSAVCTYDTKYELKLNIVLAVCATNTHVSTPPPPLFAKRYPTTTQLAWLECQIVWHTFHNDVCTPTCAMWCCADATCVVRFGAASAPCGFGAN